MYTALTLILILISHSLALEAEFPKQDVKSLPSFFLQQEMWHPHLYLAQNEKGSHIEIRDKHKFYPSFMSITFQAEGDLEKTLLCNCQMNKLTDLQVQQYNDFIKQLKEQDEKTQSDQDTKTEVEANTQEEQIIVEEKKPEQAQVQQQPQQVQTVISQQQYQSVVSVEPNYFQPFVQQQLNLQKRYLIVEEVPAQQYSMPVQQITTQQNQAIYQVIQPVQYIQQNTQPYTGYLQLQPQNQLQLAQQTPQQNLQQVQYIQVPMQQQAQQPIFLQSSLQGVPVNQGTSNYNQGFLQRQGAVPSSNLYSQYVYSA